MVSLTASARVQIARPIEEVWAFASHVPNMEQWVDGMSETELVGGGEVGRGSEIRGVYTYGGGSGAGVDEGDGVSAAAADGDRRAGGTVPVRSASWSWCVGATARR